MRALFFFLFVIPGSSLVSQQWEWVKGITGYGTSRTCIYDKVGNLYFAGSYNSGFVSKFNSQGQKIWITGIGERYPLDLVVQDSTVLAIGNGYMSASSFYQKLDSGGKVSWQYSNCGNWATNVARSGGIDSQGNFYVAAHLESTATIGGCAYAGGKNLITKLSSAGNCLWNMTLPYSEECFLTIDHSDNLVLGCPDSIMKFSNNLLVWALPLRSKNVQTNTYLSEVHCDKQNNIYFLIWGDSVKIGTSFYATQKAEYLVKVSPAGNLIWAKTYDGPVNSFEVGNNIFFAGGSYDQRIAKVSLNGDLVWCKKLHEGIFNIADIATFNDLVALTGPMTGSIIKGQDTLYKTPSAPVLAVFKDIDVWASIQDNNPEVELVFPNPVSGKLKIRLKRNSDITEIYIINSIGEKIHCSLMREEDSSTISVDLTYFPKGIYFVQINNNNRQISQKIVVQ